MLECAGEDVSKGEWSLMREEVVEEECCSVSVVSKQMGRGLGGEETKKVF